MPMDLQQINDRIEIDELLARYSRALDFRQFEELEAHLHRRTPSSTRAGSAIPTARPPSGR